MADDDLTPEMVSGLPTAVKDRPRADFRPTEFDQSIQTKGYDMWWSRSAPCPCQNNDQTDQPDILCKLCGGDGFYQFLPDPAIANGALVDRFGNPVTVHDNGKAVQIKVLMTSLTQDVQVFEKFGEWVFGTARATTQAYNRLGYRDRLTAVKSEMVWSELIEYAGGDTIPVVGARSKAGLRYPIVRLHDFRSVARGFKKGEEYQVNDAGEIEWLPQFTTAKGRPATGTRLVFHGTVRPVWVVMDHVNTYRDTQLEGGGGIATQKFKTMPTQAIVKLEFLANAE